MESWKDKWNLINLRWVNCVSELLESNELKDINTLQVKAHIEALAQDIWALRDWLINDPASSLQQATVDTFLDSPEGYHIRACGDLATRVKHFAVDDPKKHLMHLIYVGTIKDNEPVAYKAVRLFQHPHEEPKTYRKGTGDIDEYEDALEMLHRAISQWRAFLQQQKMLP